MLKPVLSDLIVDLRTHQRRSRADYALGRLCEAAAGLSDWSVLVRPTQYREIQSMLAYRGVTVTSREIASAGLRDQMAGLGPPYDVARYVRVLGQAARDVPGAPVGEILKWVACELTGWDAAWSDAGVRAEMDGLFEWIDSATDVSLVDKIARGAFGLLSLDPFPNTTDLVHVLITLLLIRSGVVQGQIVPVSVYIDRNHGRLDRLCRYVARTGDVNGLVRFFADCIAEQCSNQLRMVHELTRLPGKYRSRMEPVKRGDGVARLFAVLPGLQVVNAPQVAERCEITGKYARELLAKAEEWEIVEQVGNRKRGRTYEVTDVRRALDLYTGMVPERDRAVLCATTVPPRGPS